MTQPHRLFWCAAQAPSTLNERKYGDLVAAKTQRDGAPDGCARRPPIIEIAQTFDDDVGRPHCVTGKLVQTVAGCSRPRPARSRSMRSTRSAVTTQRVPEIKT